MFFLPPNDLYGDVDKLYYKYLKSSPRTKDHYMNITLNLYKVISPPIANSWDI